MNNYFKSILILLFIGCFEPNHLWAQKQPVLDIAETDNCEMLVSYEFVRIDTVLNRTQAFDMVLQIGPNMHRFYDVHQYQFEEEVWKHDNLMDPDDAQKLFFSNIPGCLTHWWRNTHNNYFEQRGVFASMLYQYNEMGVEQDWNMSYSDTLTVYGYLCKKATSSFRGRNWTAWYAPDLNIDAGPWKLHGLPGLILKAEESEALILFQATSIEQNIEYPVTKEKIVSERELDYQKYLEFERMAALQRDDLRKIVDRGGTQSSSDKPSPRFFYCPLEKE